MNYTDLQARIIKDAHTPWLASEAPSFISKTEALIRKMLRGYRLTLTLTDSQRVNNDQYTLVSGVREIRSIIPASTGIPLTMIGMNGFSDYLQLRTPMYYLRHKNLRIFGAPGAGDTISVDYHGIPAPLGDVSTNALLDEHEDIYITGSLYWLYMHTEDIELANENLAAFRAGIRLVNKAFSREMKAPTSETVYDFGCGGGY